MSQIFVQKPFEATSLVLEAVVFQKILTTKQ